MEGLSIDTLANLSQIAGGVSALVGVLFAVIAIPRAMWQSSQQRAMQSAQQFHEAHRAAMASGVALMDAIENRKSQIVELDPSDRSKDWRIIDILSVDIAFDTFRSEVARCLTLFVSARGFVSYHDVMALFRLKNHIYTVADVQSETDAKEEETRIGRKVHGAELEMYAYKCYVIVRYLNDLDDHPVFVRLKRAHPNAGYAMEYEHELTTEAAQKEKAK